MCLRAARYFQDSGARVQIVGFPDEIDVPRASESKNLGYIGD